jgi:hypothetical protein
VNLRWAHKLAFSGADAVHIASAIASGCVEFLTFDGDGKGKGILGNAPLLLEVFGLRAITPRHSKSLPPEKDPDAINPLLRALGPLHEGSVAVAPSASTPVLYQNPVATPAAMPVPTAHNVSVNDPKNWNGLSAIPASISEPAENLSNPSTQTNISNGQPDGTPKESNLSTPEESS